MQTSPILVTGGTGTLGDWSSPDCETAATVCGCSAAVITNPPTESSR